MTRIKFLALSAITAAMIAGFSLVTAVEPTTQDATGASLDQATAQTELISPQRMGGGTGRSLRK